MTAGLQIDLEPGTTSVVLHVAGEIDLATVGVLERCLKSLDQSWSQVVIDLAGVGFCDSTGLNLFVQQRKQFEVEGRSLHLADPTAPIRKLLAISGLDSTLLTTER